MRKIEHESEFTVGKLYADSTGIEKTILKFVMISNGLAMFRYSSGERTYIEVSGDLIMFSTDKAVKYLYEV